MAVGKGSKDSQAVVRPMCDLYMQNGYYDLSCTNFLQLGKLCDPGSLALCLASI